MAGRPSCCPAGSTGAGYVLVDTTQYLTSVSVTAGSPATVTAQSGVTLDTLTTAVAAAGYGLCAIPAPGDITIGGALAINAHGSAIPATGETALSGQTYGSLSNLILSLTAVVWSSTAGQYVLQTFQRDDPDIRAFLAHLGRAFVTQVTLQVAASQNIRCQSWVDISAAALFAPPASAGSNSLASYVNGAGRVEAIWFPFTTTPWLKVWSIAPTKPLLSVGVTGPYNYSFTNGITSSENTFFGDVATGDVGGTPAFEGAGHRPRGHRPCLHRHLGHLGPVAERAALRAAGHRADRGGRVRDHHVAGEHPAGGERLLRAVHQPPQLLRRTR